MRFSSYALAALAANLVAALPQPQDIDFDLVLAAPDPTFVEAVGVTAQSITIDPQALIASATAAISSVSIDASDVLLSTAVAQAKRAAATTCVPQPAGATSAPTYAADADNAADFLANTYYGSVASAAPTPSGYSQTFLNKQASNNAFGYMGFDTMDTYDVAKCASQCTARFGCVSFNIYFERDPSVDPNDSTCLNPSSVTMIKVNSIFAISIGMMLTFLRCVYWAGQVTSDNAVNSGQRRGGFDVAIAGSNEYLTTQISTPDGYQPGVPFGKFAINAPYDTQGYNTYMGAKIFTGAWNVDQCAKYCDAQTKYNLATAPEDGTPAKVCKFFNTYLLTAKMANGQIIPQGQYCSLYTEAWPIKYATNGGQWRGKDQYTVDYSFGYAKTDAGVDPLVGDAKGAAYQALADIKWSSLQPFCSTYLGWTVPVVSATALTSTTPVVTSTIFLTSTLAKRAVTSTPGGLVKYQSAALSSACSMAVTSPTITSTTIVATSTTTAAAQTTTVTSVSTVAAPRLGACSNGGTCRTYRVITANGVANACAIGLDGEMVCITNNSCNEPCSSNSDCGSGRACIPGSCCARNNCFSIVNVCPNTNSEKFMFNRRAPQDASNNDAGEECTGLICPSGQQCNE